MSCGTPQLRHQKGGQFEIVLYDGHASQRAQRQEGVLAPRISVRRWTWTWKGATWARGEA